MKKKALTWLHISDIHFKQTTEWRDNPSRKALLQFLNEKFKKVLPKPDLIFCTGDIAFGEIKNCTLAQQYGYAKEFFESLGRTCGLARERIFLVPGNHDIDRGAVNADAQQALNAKSTDSRKNETIINQRFEDKTLEHQNALERLKAYGTFIEQHFPHQHDSDGRHVYAVVEEIDGLAVGIGGFNSAWSCSGPEDDRHIWLAAQWQFNRIKNKLQDVNLRIGLMHHPVDWLNEAERDISTRRIASDFQFWLHGHSHNAWVKPEAHCVTVAAGAVSADHDDEFGINLVSIDLDKKTGDVHLFRYSTRDNGWVIAPIPHQAPEGIWPITLSPLPERATVEHARLPDKTTPTNPAQVPLNTLKRTQKLYGRDTLIRTLVEKSQTHNTLAIYGLRGNGKSELIQALLQQSAFSDLGQPLRITAHGDFRGTDLFRQLAPMLGDTAEYPTAPAGSKEALVNALKDRYPSARPMCIWIDKAHLLFNRKGGWINAELGQMFQACNQAFSHRLRWFFELREKPLLPSLFGPACHMVEVPGLDRNSLAQCLREAAPAGKESEWAYTGDELIRLYHWLGGGHDQQAHPLATRLLIEVAQGKQLNPREALTKLHREAQQRIEVDLLADLYQSVLFEPERLLLQTLSLYREPIPHDHADRLEAALGTTSAWARLDQRCLLPSDTKQEHFYLHGFIAEWIGDQLEPATQKRLHAVVADAWLRDLNGSTRISQPNIQRATEAFFHLLQAQQHERLEEISRNLFGPNPDWVCRQLWDYDERLFEQKAPAKSQQQVLTLITQIDPNDHKAWRFLGESLRKTEGSRSPAALNCFEHAHRLDPSFPQYLANLGDALIALGHEGAVRFLKQLTQAKEQHPESIDSYVTFIETEALSLTNQEAQASALRQSQIDEGSLNLAFYTAEAEYQASIGHVAEALALLDLAEKRRYANAFTTAIRAKIQRPSR